MVLPRERLRHEQGEDEGGLAVDLDRLGVLADLAPGDGLVGPRAGVGAVELVGRVQEHGEVRAVTLEMIDLYFHFILRP